MRGVVSARGESGVGESGVGVSAGATSSTCAIDGCRVATGASLEVGPSSGSVDVDVFVRYNAVCKKKDPSGIAHSANRWHCQTPKPGKRLWTLPSHLSNFGTKVQPLGSSIVLTPSVCTPSGKSG